MESLTNPPNTGSAPCLPLGEADAQARAREIRSRLPGQVLVDRIETARLAYGALYSIDQIRRRVERTLPWRAGSARHAVVESIESYRQRIPDDALLKYDDARASGLFSEFSVVSATYRREIQADPWIIGHVSGTELYAIIAQWM